MTGASHSSVKRYRDLARHPDRNGLERELLLDGTHLLIEAQRSNLAIESAAFDHEVLSDPEVRTLAESLAATGADVFIVSRRTLEQMSPVRTPSGAVGIARRSLMTLDQVCRAPNPLIAVAHGIQDPGNVGGILRTAEAAGATSFVTTGSTADPLGWKALRGSMGSAFRVPIASADLPEALDVFAERSIQTAALVPRDGRLLFDADLHGPTALLFGAEGSGLPPDLLARADHCISIPMERDVESLNVGVAAALVLYEAFRQRRS
jgi:TrmH family RNA methyltransferase